MSLIKIVANGIELDYVKESLTLKVENNGFSSSFKAKHNSFPFLIIENEKTKLALGSNDITSLTKKKIIDVEIYELDDKYYGQIRQLSFINGFRKCDLKYGSDLLKITTEKISKFMPIVSVIPGEVNPIPYSEVSFSIAEGDIHWKTYPQPFLNLGFPDAKWQFPTMKWADQFNDDNTDLLIWQNYTGNVNVYTPDLSEFKINSSALVLGNANDFSIVNNFVPSLQVYLFSPLLYALNSIGYSPEGDAYNHELLKRILFLSTKNNLTKAGVPFYYYYEAVMPYSWTITGIEYQYIRIINLPFYAEGSPALANLSNNCIFEYEYNIQAGQDFTIYYSVTPISTGVDNWIEVFDINNTVSITTRSGKLEFIITELSYLKIKHISNVNTNPISSYYNLGNIMNRDYYQFHPTIQTGRYLPDWTFGKYLNELQKTFNLEILEDPFSKKIYLNFIEEEYFESLPLVLDKNFKIDAKDILSNSSFVLKYKNTTDLGLIISQDSVGVYNGEKPEFSTIIDLEFKEVDYNLYTANLSEDLIEKDGVGLMVYDSSHKPYVKNSWGVYNLSISLPGGIFETFYKKTLKIRLLSSGIEIKGAFTKTELAKIKKSKTIYFDNQKFIIISYDFTETSENFLNVRMKLESVNY